MLSPLIKTLLALPLLAVLSVAVGCVVLLAGIARIAGSGITVVDVDRYISRG